MDVVIMSNSNPVNDMSVFMSVPINDLDEVIVTKSNQSA